MILTGDNIEALRLMPENSVDAIVTDPPYGLSFMGKRWDYDVPSVAFWTEALRVLKPGGHVLCFGGTRTYHRVAVNIEDAGFEVRDSIHWMYGSGFPKSLNLDGERKGWGTALKPGHEPIIVARKPLEGTVAENVAKWGTGALNIGGCRVVRLPGDESGWSKTGSKASENRSMSGGNYERPPKPDAEGRWPPNVVFTHSVGCVKGGACVEGCPVAELDRQTGPKGGAAAASGPSLTGKSTSRARGTFNGVEATPFHGKVQGASGFFPCFYPDADLDELTPFLYCAKPARSEREAGCGHLPARAGHDAVDRKEGSAGLNSPRAGSGRTAESVRNHHPTVKPVALMRWLVRLATPPGGVVLDPFCGSGTTLVAVTLEGFLGLGLERDPEYVAIAEARVAHAATAG